jgi:hypothetical protein
MLRFIEKTLRKRRAARHTKRFPEDTLVVQSLLDALDCNAKTPREAAEVALGRELKDAEWSAIHQRWERPWRAITFRRSMG